MVLFIGHVQLVFLDSMWGLNSSGVMPAPPRYLEGVVWNLKHLNLMEIHGCLCLPGHTYNNSRNLKLWILMDYMWEQQKSVVLPSRVIYLFFHSVESPQVRSYFCHIFLIDVLEKPTVRWTQQAPGVLWSWKCLVIHCGVIIH